MEYLKKNVDDISTRTTKTKKGFFIFLKQLSYAMRGKQSAIYQFRLKLSEKGNKDYAADR